jgi:ABC-type Fe3+-hydroxamate transport system substrate-binding protein
MKTWIALLSVAALLVTGCGGGSEDASSVATTSASGGALTKAELIEQGDAICAKVYAVTGTLNPEGTPEEALRIADLHGGMVKRLLALGTPQETEYSYAEYTTAAHALAQASEEIEFVAEKNDPVALRRSESGSLSTLSMFEGTAGAYGFKDCAEGAA